MEEHSHIEITWSSLDTETTGNLIYRTRAQVLRLCEDGRLGPVLESAHGLNPVVARRFYDQLTGESIAQIDAAAAEDDRLTLKLSLPTQTARSWLAAAEHVYQLLIDPKTMTEAGDAPLTKEEASMMADMIDVARSTILSAGRTDAGVAEPEGWPEIELLKRTFEGAPVGIGLVDTRLRVIAANSALCRMLGIERDEVLESSLSDVALTEEGDTERVKSVLAGEVPHARVLSRHVRPDGTELWTSALVTMVRESPGAPPYGILIFEEIRPESIAQASAAARLVMSLTTREREILQLMCEGCASADIAERLFLSRRTVETHAHKAYRKLGVSNRADAVREFLRLSNPLA